MTYLSSSVECTRCGSEHKGKPFCTYSDGVHCFSCGYHREYDRTFSGDVKKKISIPELPGLKSISDGFNVANLQWLYKYYITPQQIKNNNIHEAPDGALVFCVVKDGVVTHYQKRYIRDKRLILSYGPKTPLVSSIGSDSVVIVEDPLSAIRVGEHCDSVCLWGTKTSYEFLNSLLHYEKILVWLDNDTTKETNSGQEAAKNICKMLKHVISLEVRRRGFGGINVPMFADIVTDNDPKTYSPSEIQLILRGEYVRDAKQSSTSHSR